ncbi:SRPBCC family protein [Jatrophihabitans sp. YIM 134969]
MAHAVEVAESRTYPVSVEETFDRLLPMPLPQLFAHRFGPLPPIRSTDQDGVWGTVGQTRTIRLADGGTMLERLLDVARPHRFAYRVDTFTGALKPLVEYVDGSWTIEPAGTGSRVTWAWTLHPRGRVGAVAVPLIARFWPGYARAALGELETYLLRPA